MRKKVQTVAAAVALALVVAAPAYAAVESPTGEVIPDEEIDRVSDGGSVDDSTSGGDPAQSEDPAQTIYDEVVEIGEDGVPMVSPDASPEMIDLFEEYYDIDENGVPLAKAPETDVSPKTGESMAPVAVTAVGIFSLASAAVILKKERYI